MKMLPGDEVRQIMWRFAERYDIQMAVAGARSVARGSVAQLVAGGQRKTHDWTAEKQGAFEAFDASGITASTLKQEYGGLFDGPKNLASSLLSYELSWVDNGAATSALVNGLAMGPIAELGTDEQKAYYMTRCAPGNETGKTWRGLTEPLPYVGVDTGVLCGRVSVAEWKEGEEPKLRVEKRGRFITNIAIADYVTVAVNSGDDRIKGSCMVIVEATDPGTFDRGAQTLKCVHQLSNTGDPVIDVTVPASRIVGGYTIKDGQIVPNLAHSEIIAQVFSKTRVGVGVMGAGSLMSAIEPVIRYQRTRFRGAAGVDETSPRYQQGLQMKEDVTERLADVWATAEAASSLGFDISRRFDALELIQDEAKSKLGKGREMLKNMKAPMAAAAALLAEGKDPMEDPDVTVRYVYLQALCNILCPSCKLWNTGHGANVMREAVTLMGGYGITEDCPGFLFYKWTDMQLDATYEGPEAVQRRQISETMANPVFLAQLEAWAKELAACVGVDARVRRRGEGPGRQEARRLPTPRRGVPARGRARGTHGRHEFLAGHPLPRAQRRGASRGGSGARGLSQHVQRPARHGRGGRGGRGRESLCGRGLRLRRRDGGGQGGVRCAALGGGRIPGRHAPCEGPCREVPHHGHDPGGARLSDVILERCVSSARTTRLSIRTTQQEVIQ